MEWIGRHWRGLLGSATLIPPIFHGLVWIISRAGDVDFLVTRFEDPSWVGSVINWAIDPPGWTILPLIILGLLLIYWDNARRRPQVDSTPRVISAGTAITPRGARLITIGQSIILSAGIVAAIGLFMGAMLIIVGKKQNAAQHSEAIDAFAEKAEKGLTRLQPSTTEAHPTPSPTVTAEPLVVPTPAIKPPQPPSRVYVDQGVTPDSLMDLFEGNTALRAETLASKEIGKWMPVSGPLGEVFSRSQYPGAGNFSMVVFKFDPTKDNNRQLYMWFYDEWLDRLALLAIGEDINVIGKIKKIQRYKVELEYCELIDTSAEDASRSGQLPPSPATETPP